MRTAYVASLANLTCTAPTAASFVAVPGVCGVCADYNDTAPPVPIVSASFYPSVLTADTQADKLLDGFTGFNQTNMGAVAAASAMNYIQAQLDMAWDNISHVRMWAGAPSSQTSSGFLTLWLSPTDNFTQSGTKCVEGAAVLSGQEGTFTCPPNNGTRFVTVVRSADVAEALDVLELNVIRSGETGAASSCC